MLKIIDIIELLKQIKEKATVIEYGNEPILVEKIDHTCPYKKYKSAGNIITIKIKCEDNIDNLVEKIED